jgi:predicted nucleic acid-binding protein
MPRVVRMTVTVAGPLFRAVERERRARRAPRSAVVGEALVTWLRERARAQKVRRYVEAYRRFPVDEAEAAEQAASLAAEAWSEGRRR